MKISLRKADESEIGLIWELQQKAFLPLLMKYEDYDVNPACESAERVAWKFSQPETSYYIFTCEGADVGGIRVFAKPDGRCKIAPVFVIPEYQGRGIAQAGFKMIEELYPHTAVWELDTILEEAGNCHLYEKLGYVKTGAVKKLSNIETIVFYEKKGREET
jgi:GNAT superfamily N-acetyltransferase